jgi:hypothetical protein
MPVSEASYTERYCAFIDILGFRGLIDDLERGKATVGEIYNVLSAIHAQPNALRRQEADLRSQSISDAVALSAACNAAGLDAICTATEELSRRLLRSGYFARGGIAKGRLYHDQNTVFGPALVEAYRLESQVAKFPRIVVPRLIVQDGPSYSQTGTHWKMAFEKRFLQSRDGPFFLHILRDYSQRRESKKSGDLSILKAMRRAIQRRFNEASDNPDHFQKIAWFVEYWNGCILPDEDLDSILSEPV